MTIKQAIQNKRKVIEELTPNISDHKIDFLTAIWLRGFLTELESNKQYNYQRWKVVSSELRAIKGYLKEYRGNVNHKINN